MDMPINCPICSEPIINQFVDISFNESFLKKAHWAVNHFIAIESEIKNHDKVYCCYLTVNRQDFIWNFNKKILEVYYRGTYSALPYFNPDFSNYPKLIHKLKTYITFL